MEVQSAHRVRVFASSSGEFQSQDHPSPDPRFPSLPSAPPPSPSPSFQVWGIGHEVTDDGDECRPTSSSTSGSRVWHQRLAENPPSVTCTEATARLKRAEDIKTEGNDQVKAKKWAAAEAKYCEVPPDSVRSAPHRFEGHEWLFRGAPRGLGWVGRW